MNFTRNLKGKTMLLMNEVDLRAYAALCAQQQENLEQQRELLRAGDRAGAARCGTEQHRIHQEANQALARALGWRVSKRHATACDLIAGKFSYQPCVSVAGGSSLIDHTATLVLPSRPRRPHALITHSYAAAAEIARLATEGGLRAEMLPASSWNPRPNGGGTTAAILTVRGAT
jgi:hypothetical protein